MHSRWFYASLSCVVLFIVLAAIVWFGLTDAHEMALIRRVITSRNPSLTNFIQVLTFITSATPALLLSLGACVADWRISNVERRTMTTFVTRHSSFVLAFFGALVCNIGLRLLIGRLRPQVEPIANLFPEITAGFQRYAFPSGHAGSATLAYFSWVIVLWRFRRARWIALAVTLFVWLGTGIGRVYLGVQWPTDVLGGYLLSGAWVCAALAWRHRLAI